MHVADLPAACARKTSIVPDAAQMNVLTKIGAKTENAQFLKILSTAITVKKIAKRDC